MSTASIKFHSQALNQTVEYNVILPDRGDGPFPVLIQMHGLTDDHDGWLFKSNLWEKVRRLPLIVVLPNGGTSGYVNWKSGNDFFYRNNYEDLIVEDIPDHLRRHFHVTDGPWAIGGLSMGGYGSMRLGLKYPDKFSSIWAHSSAFRIKDFLPSELVIDGDDGDVFKHAERLVGVKNKPAISFDCGVDDQLIDENRQLHAYLDELGIEHHYAEHAGAHTWDYWDEHVREALGQHCRVLGIEEIPDPPPPVQP